MIDIKDAAGKMPDGMAAQLLGTTVHKVRDYRKEHEIEKFGADMYVDLETWEAWASAMRRQYNRARMTVKRRTIDIGEPGVILEKVGKSGWVLWTERNGMITWGGNELMRVAKLVEEAIGKLPEQKEIRHYGD